jgi:hypothetical protein
MTREALETSRRKRMLGNMRFIGELHKKPNMLNERVMHECLQKLLGDLEHPSADDMEVASCGGGDGGGVGVLMMVCVHRQCAC